MIKASKQRVRALTVCGTVGVLLFVAGSSGLASQGGAARRQAAAAPKQQSSAASPGALRSANGDSTGRPPNRGVFLARALRQVNLTPEQIGSIRQIRGRFDTRMREIGRRFIDARRQLDQSVASENPALDRARDLTAEISKLAGERATTRTVIELEVIQTLSSEQRARLRALRGVARDKYTANAGAAIRGRRRGQGTVEPQAGALQGGGAEDTDPDSDAEAIPDVSGKPSRPDKVRKPPIRQLLDRLQLTPEQQIQMRQLRRKHAPLMRESNRQFRDAQRAVDDALLADTLDAELVRKLAGALGQADAERTLERLQAEIEVRSILTPSQRAVWSDARMSSSGVDGDDAP